MAISSSKPNHQTELKRRAAAAPAERGQAVTGRALVLGAIGAVTIALGTMYGVHVLRGSPMAYDYGTPAAVFVLFVLVAGPNLLLLRVRRGLALTSAELITIYSMMIVACAVSTWGLVGHWIPEATGVFYYASPENNLGETIAPHIPTWLRPEGAEVGAPVIQYMYEGLPPGGRVPWGAWQPFLLGWLPFLFTLQWVMICAMVLLRKQWVSNERLSYPLTYLPLSLVGAETQGWPMILKKTTFWIGFAIAFVTLSFIALNNYFPSMPRPNLIHQVTIIENVLSTYIWISFALVGFYYLVPLEASFSVWFWFMVTKLLRTLQVVLGLPLSTPGLDRNGGLWGNLSFGTMIGMMGSTMWVARRHLASVWQVAMGRETEADSGEAMSLRLAFWGLVAGLVVMVWWLAASGLPVIAAVLLVIAFLIVYIVMTRVVVETGMSVAQSPIYPPHAVSGWLGYEVLGNQGIVALMLAYTWTVERQTSTLGSAAHSLKMAEKIKGGQRLLVIGLVAAAVLAIVSATWLQVDVAYREGGINLSRGLFAWPAQYPATRWAGPYLEAPPDWSVAPLMVQMLGAGIYLALAAMRFRYANWPFHPIGLTIATHWVVNWIWISPLLAWLIKSTILRYGGLKGYDVLRPVFLGLICGQFTCKGFWLIIDYFAGHTGNSLGLM